MTKKFIPTKEQFEKLAKVAGAELKDFIETTKLYSYYTDKKKTKAWFWQPHLDRNQIAMIIKGLTDKEQKLYFDRILDFSPSNQSFAYFLSTLDSSISCEFLCEVIG